MPPPLLYDLTELQRHANRLFGFSAQKTLELAQALYERHKLHQLPAHRQPPPFRGRGRDAAARRARHRRALRRAARAGHRRAPARHAASSTTPKSPTTTPSSPPPLRPERLRSRRKRRRSTTSSAAACSPLARRPHLARSPPSSRRSRNGAATDRYHTAGTTVQQMGWKVLDPAPGRRRSATRSPRCRPSSPWGSRRPSRTWRRCGRRRSAPKRFTEGTLLTAMETAGKTLDEKELSDAMKESGLGTPATRAAIIEVLSSAATSSGGQEPGGHRQGHPADRGGPPGGEEPRHDGPVGGLPEADSARQGGTCAVHRGHRGLRPRSGGQSRAGTTAHAAAAARSSDRAPPPERARPWRRSRTATSPPCSTTASASPPSAPTRKRSAAPPPPGRTSCS